MEQFIDDHAADVNTCIILNKAVQHLIPEILSSIRDEVKHLSAIQRELEFDFVLSRLPDHLIRKPFLRLVSEVPPLNEDAELRLQRNEYNLIDARSSAMKKWAKRELDALVSGVARSACERQITLLTSHRELLLSKIAAASKQKGIVAPTHTASSSRTTTKNTADLLAELRSTEDRLERLNSISSAPSRNLISALVSVALDAQRQAINPRSAEMQRLWEEKIFEGYNGPKFIREHHARTWYELLESADTLLRSSEWDEISVQDFNSSVSPANLRLTWHHRLRPGLNHGRWTAAEDEKLTELVNRFGQRGHWEEIAESLGSDRTAFMCLQRWQTKLNPEFELHRPWSAAEETALLDILKRFLEIYAPPLIDWDAVAAYHNTRTAIECRSRALLICPAFSKSSFRLPGTILPNAPDRYRDLERAYSYRPFTPSEDLQLLMSIQRHGLAGGRLGSGGGIGVGSWAIVSTSLPGRSVRTCQHRYMELCEQFQPWTYSEDRKLYHMRLQLEPNFTFVNRKRVVLLSPFERLLKYFPGRSVYSLRHRFVLLYGWSRTWASLRQITASQLPRSLHTREECNGETQTSITSKHRLISTPELRQLLLYSPFASQLIAQLRNSGVADPEAEALRLFTTWELKETTTNTTVTTTDGASLSQSQPTIDSEFSQLLDDLVSGRLVPCPLVTNAPSARMNTEQVPVLDGEAGELDSSTMQLSICPARKLVSHVLLRQFLNRPIRQYLETMTRHSLVADSEEQTDSPTGPSEFVARLRPSSSARAAAAFALLDDNSLFSSTLDKALLHPNASRALAAKDKVASLRRVAPLLARLMVRSLLTCEEDRNTQKQGASVVQTTSTDIDTCQPETQTESQPESDRLSAQAPLCQADTQLEPQPECGLLSTQASLYQTDTPGPVAGPTANTETTEDQTDSATVRPSLPRAGSYNLAGMKRHKLLEIRRLLLQRGRQWKHEGSAYSIATSSWPGPKDKLSLADSATRPRRYVPPVLRALPPDIAIQIYRDPEVIASECRTAARACVAHGLGLIRPKRAHNAPRDGTVQAADDDDNELDDDVGGVNTNPARILPPNYATIFALKSLLLNLTTLVRRAGSGFTDYIRSREDFRTVLGNQSGGGSNQTATTSANPDGLDSRQTGSARLLLSPEYVRFIRVGLSLILWPAMLSTLPAQAFVMAGKRRWEQIYNRLPENLINTISTVTIPQAKVPRLESETSDSDSECLLSDEESDDEKPTSQSSCPLTRCVRRQRTPVYAAAHRAAAVRRRFRHRYGFSRLLTEHTQTFKIADANSAENDKDLSILFPSTVQTLYACGFRPHSILRITR